MGLPPFVNYGFDVSPKTFEPGAVEALVGQTVMYRGLGEMVVESAKQTNPSAAALVLKPTKAS